MTAMTISDTERREVARKLRAAKRPSLMVLLDVLGVGGDGAFARLADLIEPSCDRDTPQKVAEEMFGKMRHSTKEEADAYDTTLKSMSVEIHPVDRDALLALADEMDAYSIQFGTGLQACTIQAWAFSIREALGVSDD